MIVMASKITKRVFPLLGKGLAATTDIQAGEEILHLAVPSLSIPENASLERVCAHCLYAKEDLKKCSRCKILRYCSPKCQELSWKGIHKHECKLYASLQPQVLPTEVRALLRILLRQKHDPSAGRPWQDLVSHEKDLRHNEKRWREIVLQATGTIKYARMPNDAMSMAVGILCQVR